MPGKDIRVRFAPSPTGSLHVGGARTALFNWLFAKKNSGKFILRIEDTDQVRYDAESEVQLMKDLQWLGLDWDEGPDKPGSFGPYKQSENLEIYKTKAHELVANSSAYYCFCTSERLDELRAQQKKEKASITGYDRCCRNLSEEDVKENLDQGLSHVVRLKTPLEGTTNFFDLLRGEITYSNEVLDDLILFKSNGFPSYHLASIIDDHNMKISHVLRGEEWIPSAAKHILIHQALGFEPPIYVHLPVILAEGGKKLSKRKGAASVTDYRERNYLPDTLNNFLALLGWNPGSDLELMDRESLVSHFSLEKISPKSCFFDEKKLDWMNTHYFQKKTPEDLLEDVKKAFKEKGLEVDSISKSYFLKVISLLKERCHSVPDFVDIGAYFFQDPIEYDKKADKKRFKEPTSEILVKIISQLESLDGFESKLIENEYHDLAQKLGFENAGKLIHPTRLAISGLAGGPGLFEIMEMIGKDSVVKRLNNAIHYLENKFK